MEGTTAHSRDTDPYRSSEPDVNELNRIIFRVLSNWYWFVLTIILALAIAFVYNRYTSSVYEIQSSLLIQKDYAGTPLGALVGRNQGMFEGSFYSYDRNYIYNQIAILNSTPIVATTLDHLDFELSFYAIGRVTEIELHGGEVPFQIVWDKNHPQLIDLDFYLTIQPGRTMNIRIEGVNARVYDYSESRVIEVLPKVSYQADLNPGVSLKADFLSFTVLLREDYNPFATHNYKFRFNAKASLVSRYKAMLSVYLANDQSSILNLSVRDYNVRRGIDFLNRLTEVYQVKNLEKKNENADLAIGFIESQLKNISDSLSVSENQLEAFKRDNQMINMSVQTQQLLAQVAELDRELARRETQNRYYYYLRDYIEGSRELETVVAPSTVGIDDPLLNSFIVQLNKLIDEKSGLTAIRHNSQHPTIVQLNAQIDNVRQYLRESISNIILQAEVELRDLQQRLGGFNARISQLPANELAFVNFERKYKIYSETYTFLLQKLSEAQITKASSVPDSQVIEEPRMSSLVKPQRRRTYAIALLLGFILPAGIIFLRDFFNNRIASLQEIRSVTGYPILGHVSKNIREADNGTIVLDKPASRSSEQFRSIRGKLNLMTRGVDTPVIAVLSAHPKEGKTFNVINIASSFALMNKKVVILDLDLRNSKMKKRFNIKGDGGIVDYLAGTATLQEIIHPSRHPMLDIIPSGPVPVRPAEMLLDARLAELVAALKERYDVIIVDSAPVGVVADVLPLHNMIDAAVFVVRHKLTKRQHLMQALAEVESYSFRRVGIVVCHMHRGKIDYDYLYGYGS